MTQVGPAAFRKSVESRNASRQEGLVRKVRALLAAIEKADSGCVKFALKKRSGTIKGVMPGEAWQDVVKAAAALKGV